MAEQIGKAGIGGGVSTSQPLLERLQRSASTLDGLSEEVGLGVCIASDAPGAALKQEAEALRQVGAQLQLLLKSWALIAELSNRLLNLPLDELEGGIRAALHVLGQHSEAQRCYLFLFTEDGRQIADAYEWCAPGVQQHDLDSFRGVSVEAFPWSMKQWLSGQTIIVTDPARLPPEASPERGACEALQIASYVNAPLFFESRLMGWLGYDAVGEPRSWSQEELRLMALASDVLMRALERKRRDELSFEREFQQRLESMTVLAAGLAHEINNPLSFVSSNLNYMQELLPREPQRFTVEVATECQELLAEALEGTGRIRRIAADLKTFASKKEAEGGSVDLKAIVDSTLRMVGHQLRHRTQVVRAYGEVPLVRGTVARLGQVVLNLILNAAQAMPEGRGADNRLTLALQPGPEAVTLAITDTGCGIPPEVLPRIFEPFFTTKGSSGGSGLGLAICRNIVNSFGGEISVRSEVGKGTTVEVVLPRAERAQATPGGESALSA